MLRHAVEVEFLTYRRLSEADPWMSPELDLTVLRSDLNN